MSAPPTSAPARPDQVPGNATWENTHDLWRVGRDDEGGQWHGPQRTYRRDGSLIGEFDYVNGKPDGKFRRFHPTGELSIEGEHQLGIPVGARVTFRSSGLSDEAVHSCCLPPKAFKIVARYHADGRILEDFFDAEGRLILTSGEPHPSRPEGVTDGARFDPSQRVWIDGSYERAKRHGEFTFWTESGHVIERAHFKHGALDGLRERNAGGRNLERRMYKGGEPDGPAWERVSVGHFESTEIAAREGYYEKGVQTGKWRYLSETGRILATVDLGQPLHEVPLDDAILRTVTPQDNVSLDPAREHLRRLVCLAHTADEEALRDAVSAVPQTTREVSVSWAAQLRNGKTSPSQYVAQLLQALLRGLRPEHALRALAACYLREPAVGLQLLRVSLALAPDEVETRALEVLLVTALGRLDEARHKITELAANHPEAAVELRFDIKVTFPEFNYWPSRATLPPKPHASAELPDAVARDLPALRSALVKAAKRLCMVRAALVSLFPQDRQFALPPDLSAWARAESLDLENYTFESDEDTVEVQEKIDLNGLSLTELMLQARTEWSTVCWLHYACGATATAPIELQPLPDRLLPPPNFGAALTLAFQDLYRVTDQLQTAGIRSRNQGLPDCSWEGCSVSQLSRSLLLQAFTEYRERRAALFFAADATCRSVWQDDLRAT